jgi:D-aminopeptidase
MMICLPVRRGGTVVENLDLMLLRHRVDRSMQRWNRPDSPGMAVGVVRDGELVVHRQAGQASLELGVPVGPATAFRIASVSKQFTCAAILLLAAEGRLGVQDGVRIHIPELPDYGQRLTIAHLMHNTSGIRDMLELMRQGGVDLSQPCRREDLLAAICRQRSLNFAPGSRYLYSNSSFFLLGEIVERVTGDTLPAFLQRRLFSPIGMNLTRMTESTTEVAPGLATGYMPRRGGGWVRATHAFPLGGEGGLVSCVEDLALWDRNLTTGRIGGIALTEALEKQEPFTNGRMSHYTRGLSVGEQRGVRTVEHGGQWPGFRTNFLRAPSLGLAVICISNDGSADPYHLGHEILDAAIEGRPGVHPMPTPPPAAELSRYPGRYLEPQTGATVEFVDGDAGVKGSLYGLPFQLAATPDGRLAADRSAPDFTASLSPDGATLTVEFDAGVVSTYRRVTADAKLPTDLPGAYMNPDVAATWTISRSGDAMTVQVSGPLLAKSAPWEVEPIEGDCIRIYPPGRLDRIWVDVHVLRDPAGAIAGLEVNGGRARHLTFGRVELEK